MPQLARLGGRPPIPRARRVTAVERSGDGHPRRPPVLPADRLRVVVRRTARVLLAAIAAAAVAAVLLLVLTPSADSTAARAQRWMAEHDTGPALGVLPDRIATAVLAVEDHRFRTHPGLDAIALARMARGVVTGVDEGGSTIEVQLAKQLYTGGRHRLPEQIEQAAIAVKLDRRYTKTQILLMYLDTEYFGHGFYGVTAAARGYFGTDPQHLTWAQAALLAGLLKAPTDDDPYLHPDRALLRRQHVLERLHTVGALSEAQVAAMAGSDLRLVTGASLVAGPRTD